MDAAALSLKIDSSSVVKATSDLDRFAAASDRAAAAAARPLGNAAKNAESYARAADRANQYAGSAMRAAAANDNVASAAARAAAGINSISGSFKATMGPMSSVAASAATVSVNFTTMGRATQQADAHMVAYRNHLASLPAAANAAAAGINRVSSAARDGARNMQATPGNIAAQFQDIGVTAAMGMSPLLIALQQGTQLSAAFAGGGLKSLGAALRSVISPASLLTIAIVALVAILIQWAMEAFAAAEGASKLSKAIEQTKLTSYALGDAQSALGLVIDLTTGKIKSQSEALRGLARAQLEVIRVTAIRDQAEARKIIAEQRGRNTPITGGAAMGSNPYSGIGLSGGTSASEPQRLLDQFTSGKLNPTQAIDGLERLRKAGKLTEDQFIRTTGAIANYGVAGENLKVYADARKALEGDQGALRQFLDPPNKRNGGKSDAERLADILRTARAEIVAEENRLMAVGMSARAAAELEQRTKLLNQAEQAGIPITAGLRTSIDELAKAYADAKIAADTAVAIDGVTEGIRSQIDAVNDATSLIGLYGDALIRAQNETEALRKAHEALPRGVDLSKEDATRVANEAAKLSRDEILQGRLRRAEELRKTSEDAAFAMELERKGLYLTGEAALSYAFAAEKLNDAKRAGIDLAPDEIAGIKAAGDAYAKQRYAIDRQKQALADTREVVRGFFTDWTNGVRQGGNVFKSFADAVVNALNRITDKLLDRALTDGLDKLFAGGNSGGGGFLNNLLSFATSLFGGGNAASTAASSGAGAFGFARGGAFDQAQRFANGGAFTNRIVNTPTLFRFANGAGLGEMGEAGPEAIMPLKRGPNGALGVQMHGGGRPAIRMGDIQNNFKFDGAVGLDAIIGLIRQGGAETVSQVKRELEAMLEQLERDGTFAS